MNISVEMSLVDFVFQTLNSCGKSARVVKAAAIKPMIVIVSIMLLPIAYMRLVFTFRLPKKLSMEKPPETRLLIDG